MVADIMMFVINLSSVCNLVDGGALSLASCRNKLYHLHLCRKNLIAQSAYFLNMSCWSLLSLLSYRKLQLSLLSGRVNNHFKLCRTNQSINKYLESKCNMLGIITKKEIWRL